MIYIVVHGKERGTNLIFTSDLQFKGKGVAVAVRTTFNSLFKKQHDAKKMFTVNKQATHDSLFQSSSTFQKKRQLELFDSKPAKIRPSVNVTTHTYNTRPPLSNKQLRDMSMTTSTSKSKFSKDRLKTKPLTLVLSSTKSNSKYNSEEWSQIRQSMGIRDDFRTFSDDSIEVIPQKRSRRLPREVRNQVMVSIQSANNAIDITRGVSGLTNEIFPKFLK